MRNVLFLLAAALLAPQAMAAAPYPAKPSRGSTPDEPRALVNSEMAKWAVKTAGIQPE